MPEKLPLEPPGEAPGLERKDWLGAGGSVLAIALSVLGMNKDPAFRTAAVVLMLLAAGTAIAAITVNRFRRVTTSLAIVLVVGSVAILTLAPDPAPPRPTPPAPRLTVSQVEVNEAAGGDPAALDITVRNDGEQVAVLTAVELTVRDSGVVKACEYGGNVEVTGVYQAALPDHPHAGQVVRVALHQQVEPGAVDRFTISLREPVDPTADPREGSLDSYLYLFDVGVDQDAAGSAVSAGPVLFEAGAALGRGARVAYFPAPREATQADAEADSFCTGNADCAREVSTCWNANRATLERLLSVRSTRSQGADETASALGVG